MFKLGKSWQVKVAHGKVVWKPAVIFVVPLDDRSCADTAYLQAFFDFFSLFWKSLHVAYAVF